MQSRVAYNGPPSGRATASRESNEDVYRGAGESRISASQDPPPGASRSGPTRRCAPDTAEPSPARAVSSSQERPDDVWAAESGLLRADPEWLLREIDDHPPKIATQRHGIAGLSVQIGDQTIK